MSAEEITEEIDYSRCIDFYGETIYAPEGGISVAEWVEAAASDPRADEEMVRFFWEIAQAFAAKGIT
jgi:hypothetical protein